MEMLPYALAFLENLVLEAANPGSVLANRRDEWPEIPRPHTQLTRLYTIPFEFRKRKFSLLPSNSPPSLSSLHPDFSPTFSRQANLFDDDPHKPVFKEALRQYGIREETIINWCVTKEAGSTIFILTHDDWALLSDAERDFYRFASALMSEVQQVRKWVKQKFFALASEKESRVYIQKKQSALQSLYEETLRHINADTFDELFVMPMNFDEGDRLRFALRCVGELLIFIKDEFGTYHDDSLTVPCHTLDATRKRVDAKSDLISRKLATHFEIGLNVIIIEPIRALTYAAPSERLTWRRLNFCSQYIEGLYSAIVAHKFSAETAPALLAELNLNSYANLEFQIKILKSGIARMPLHEEQICWLYALQKEVKQRLAISRGSWDSNAPSVNAHVLSWIEAEIEYLEKKLHVQPTAAPASSSPASKEPGKLKAGVSVGKLALMFSLLNDVDFIQTENKSDLFRFIADHFRTENAENISWRSISTKAYESETASIDGVHDLLMRMQNRLRERE